MATKELSVSLAASARSGCASRRALRPAARHRLGAVVPRQWAVLYYIVSVYGRSTPTGDFAAWKKATFLRVGYVPGDDVGNLTFGLHALLAAVIAFGGVMQLIPQLRTRFAAVHRWN